MNTSIHSPPSQCVLEYYIFLPHPRRNHTHHHPHSSTSVRKSSAFDSSYRSCIVICLIIVRLLGSFNVSCFSMNHLILTKGYTDSFTTGPAWQNDKFLSSNQQDSFIYQFIIFQTHQSIGLF